MAPNAEGAGCPLIGGHPAGLSEGTVIVVRRFTSDDLVGLGFLRMFERQDGGYVDFRGAGFHVGTLWLELAIPNFTFDFHKGAFLRPAAQAPSFVQTTQACHSVLVRYSPESLSFQLTLVAIEKRE
jgi:hypothetical protein